MHQNIITVSVLQDSDVVPQCPFKLQDSLDAPLQEFSMLTPCSSSLAIKAPRTAGGRLGPATWTAPIQIELVPLNTFNWLNLLLDGNM